ncbi:hypothetical protein CAPTEDRAFT_216789 [Capitella teleta]|uniref:Uncharacterized protein n=1 Tax=Capitella teleta TaxID=283909 RepID=R7V6J1_CAPTE|nr:hypothetical protein CAPTEDRAFT_216789 [Capitella teleta]|eukprot:ELU11981.1 hypothetical protein CAPTEDRAFT_216789 [Capitella teleta]
MGFYGSTQTNRMIRAPEQKARDRETIKSWFMLLNVKDKTGDKLWIKKCLFYGLIQLSPNCMKKIMVEPVWYDLLLKNDLVYCDEDAINNYIAPKRFPANGEAWLFIAKRLTNIRVLQCLVNAVQDYQLRGDFAAARFRCLQEANAFRGKGNQYFQKGDFAEAIESYTKGLDLNPYCHLLYSNRALCYLKLNEFNKAFHDGWFSTLCGMGYVKGFHRAIEASCALGNFDVARSMCISGLRSNPGYKGLQSYLVKISALIEGQALSPNLSPAANFTAREPRSTPDTPPNVQVNPAKSSLVEEQNGSNIDLQVKLVEAQSQATYLEGVVADLTDDIDNIRKNAAVEIDKINERAVNAEVASLVHFDAVFISFRHSQLEILELRKEAAIVRLRQKLQLAELAAENAGDNFAKKGDVGTKERHVSCLKEVADVKRAIDKVEVGSKFDWNQTMKGEYHVTQRQYADHRQQVQRGTPLASLPVL